MLISASLVWAPVRPVEIDADSVASDLPASVIVSSRLGTNIASSGEGVNSLVSSRSRAGEERSSRAGDREKQGDESVCGPHRREKKANMGF